MTTVFMSYATPEFEGARDRLCESADRVGFNSSLGLGPSDWISTEFANQNARVLNAPKGAGYWLWKPYLIRKTLSQLKTGDVLVYSDAGRSSYYRLGRFPHSLVNKLKANGRGILLGPTTDQHGPLSKWTKRDCLTLLESDTAEILNLPSIQATWSLWQPTDEAFEFLRLWEKFCSDPRCVSDDENVLGQPNHPDFIAHRHDQAILTLLAYKYKIPHLNYSDSRVFKWLSLRPQSGLTNMFFKRLEDAERLEKQAAIVALWAAYRSLKKAS